MTEPSAAGITDIALPSELVDTAAAPPDPAEAIITELTAQAQASMNWSREHTDVVRRAEYRGEARAYRDAAQIMRDAQAGRLPGDVDTVSARLHRRLADGD